MGICTLGEILQEKVDKLLGDIKGVETHIKYILVFIKDRFSKHVYQIRVIFARMRTAGLKVNALSLPQFVLILCLVYLTGRYCRV